MPIYEYHCDNCNINFESLVFGNEIPECPTCQGKNLHKLMSACGFVSKDGGGQTVSRSAADSSCTGCQAASCSSCG